jgi:4-carboxymuconolactone decarboxylase
MTSRVPLVKYEQLSPAARDIYRSILKTRGNLDGPFLAWLYSPGLAAPAEALGAFCRYNTSLTAIESELLILLVAAHFRCIGEWQIHAPIASSAGLASAAIDAIRTGLSPRLSSLRLSVLHSFSNELLNRNRIDEASFDQAREMFGDRGCVEIAGVIGYYSFVAMTLNAFGIRCADNEDPFGDGVMSDLR